MRTLAREIDGLELPAVEKISESQKQDPFQILISTLLSARTQDATTLAASTRLFASARTPQAIAKLRVKQIEKLIYPVGFYRNKAVFVRDTAKAIIEKKMIPHFKKANSPAGLEAGLEELMRLGRRFVVTKEDVERAKGR